MPKSNRNRAAQDTTLINLRALKRRVGVLERRAMAQNALLRALIRVLANHVS